MTHHPIIPATGDPTPPDHVTSVDREEEEKEPGQVMAGSDARQSPLPGQQTATQDHQGVHPSTRGLGKGQSRNHHGPRTQVTLQVATASAALVIALDFYVGQPHGPSVPWPVADFEGLAWHLVAGVHQGHGDQAIREGDADEHVPVGCREKVLRAQGIPAPLLVPLLLTNPAFPRGLLGPVPNRHSPMPRPWHLDPLPLPDPFPPGPPF